MAQRAYEVFHIVIREGYAAARLDRVLASWQPLLPGRTFVLDDHRRIAELVVSIIEITEGRDAGEVAASWPGAAAAVVAKAIGERPKRRLLPFF